MNMQNSTTSNGRTGFWMRAGRGLSVRVVNGTMYKLLNAREENTLIPISSQLLRREIFVQALMRNGGRKTQRTELSAQAPLLGATGFKVRYYVPVLESSTTLALSVKRKQQVGMSQNTFSNQPFSRLIGLRDGSAYATLKVFHDRRKNRAKQ